MALLVLLAGTARARVVTPDLGAKCTEDHTANTGALGKPWLEKDRPGHPPQHFLPKRSTSGEFRILVARKVHGDWDKPAANQHPPPTAGDDKSNEG